MLFRGDVAEHGGPVPSDHGRADGRRDVVIARSYIGDERPQRVERSLVAKLDFFFHLLLDLVHGDVAGAFDHDLHVMLPGLFRQLAESLQFGELSFVAGVGDTAGPQAIAQRKADVVFLENLAQVIEALVEKILFVVVSHPLREDGAATADDAGDAFRNQRQILNEHAGVNGHVVHALRRLLFDDFEHYFRVQVLDALDPRDGFIDRDRPDRHWRIAQNGLANLVNVAAGRKIHHRVGAIVHGGVQLFQFLVDLGSDGGVADVGVDLAERRYADRHGLEFGMVDVGGDDHAPASNFVAHQLGR